MDDPEVDRKVSGFLLRGMKYIEGIAGQSLDYSTEDKPRALLFDYAHYVRSNALAEFQGNYLHELLALQISEEVKGDTGEASGV